MKVNSSVLWLYALSVVFLCIFDFGSFAATSVARTSTSPTTSTPAITKRNRKQQNTNTTNIISSTTEGIVRRNVGSSRTGVSRPTKPSLEVTGPNPKGIRQLDIPPNRKKNSNPKKFTTTEGKFSLFETTSGPIKIDFPKPNFRIEKTSPVNSRKQLICPRENEVKFELFPRKCERSRDCNPLTTKEICCNIFGAKSCVGGLPKPLEESTHSPIFGIIPRHCPQRPLAELWWDVKVCETDTDCWPRVCCPDGQRRYCRSSQPELDIVPVPVKRSLNYLSEYLECTPAPPPIFDLHPKPCNSTFDCFPNVCCQEAGKKHCRPPKKSVLTFMANFLNLGLVKRLTKNLVIK